MEEICSLRDGIVAGIVELLSRSLLEEAAAILDQENLPESEWPLILRPNVLHFFIVDSQEALINEGLFHPHTVVPGVSNSNYKADNLGYTSYIGKNVY